MGELLEFWPSAGLTLFSRFAVGSRDKPGFLPDQSLRDVLRRNLRFDVEAVLQVLEQAEAEQRQFRLSPGEFSQALQTEGLLVDCRSQAEFQLFTLAGARWLDGDLATEIRCRPRKPLWLFDHYGPMAEAAAVHFQKLGCQHVRVLEGGLDRWAREVDRNFLLYGSRARLRAGGPGLLCADPHQARFALPQIHPDLEEADPAALPFDCHRAWRHGQYLAVLRTSTSGWLEVAAQVQQWLACSDYAEHPWRACPPNWEAARPGLEEALRLKVQPNLVSHKGTIELVSWRDGVAGVRLGGGCQGCSSAAITVNQEVAEALFQVLPELVAVEDASDHLDPNARPHH